MEKLKFYDDFRKGINDTISPNQLKDNEMFVAENVDLNERGGFSTREGTEKINQTSLDGRITAINEWSVGAEERLIVCRKRNSDGVIEVGELKNDVFTSKQIILDETPSMFVLKNYFYIVDTVDAKIYEWGMFDFVSTQGTVELSVGEIVLADSDNKFYESLTVSGTINLTVQDFTDVAKWKDVTGIENIVSTTCRELNESPDATNNMTPIKKCTMFEFHNDSLRMFASGNPDNPCALYYSEYNDFGYFKETSVIYPTTNEGKVLAIKDFADVLAVSFANRWYFWRGVTIEDAVWRPLPLNYGCYGYQSLADTPMSLSYLGRNAIHQVDINLVSNQVISMQSYEMVNSISEGAVENIVGTMVKKELSRGVFHQGKYYLFYCDDETLDSNNKVLVYNWISKGFSTYSGWDVRDIEKTSNGDLLIASENYVLKVESGTSDVDISTGLEKAIEIKAVTKNYYMDSFLNPKKFNRVFFVFQQKEHDDSEVMVKLNGNYVEEPLEMVDLNVSLSESLIWDRGWGSLWGWSDMIIKTFFPEAVANYINIEVSNIRLNDPVTFYAIGFEYEILSPENESERYREVDLLSVD